MAIIVGIKFRNTNKVYYFDPKDVEFNEGDGVIVETARGLEYAYCALPNKNVDEKEIVQPLKPVVRKATAEDDKTLERNQRDKEHALKVIREKVVEMNVNMKLVDAEYTFDRSKLIFYFTADGRVDFRELVKDLASAFRVRIELRQIYERDDIKMRGALAPCGRPCCCAVFLQNYDKVSIKMAKIQGLSLNPGKINGVCGKLMCCLRYENDFYAEEMKKMPKVGSKVITPDGQGTAVGNDIYKEEVKVKLVDKEGGVEYKIYPVKQLKGFAKQKVEEITDDVPEQDGEND